MQTSSARIGLLFLLALIAVAAYVVVDHPLAETQRSRDVAQAVASPSAASPPAPAASSTVEPARPEPAAAPSMPVTPIYTTRADPPPASPIYRCRVGSRTVYTQEPCDDGRVVDTANAVGGFETKPSDRFERLVADGRSEAATTNAASAPRVTAAPRRTTVECATFAQQIRDLDEEASIPNTPRGQDRIRRIRQDVQASMARQRC